MPTERPHARCSRWVIGVTLSEDDAVSRNLVRKHLRGDRQPLRGWTLVRHCAVGLLVLWLLPFVASAQIGPGFAVSLELMVSEADVIVQGTVERVARRDQPPAYDLDVVVRVTDTLKGPHLDSIEFNEVDRSPSHL